MPDSAFSKEIDASLARGVPRAALLIAFAYVSFIPVDMAFKPPSLVPFIELRACFMAIALLIFLLTRTARGRRPWVMRALGYAAVTACASGISWLTAMTGGSSGAYWTMIMLTFFGGTMLLRFANVEVFLLYSFQIVSYVFTMLWHGEAATTTSFVVSVGGLTLAMVVCITGNAYIRILMRHEFDSRQSLARANEKLKKTVTQLEYQRQQAQLKHLTEKLEIANDLHDTVGAQLSQITVLTEKPKIESTHHLRALAQLTLENVRNFSHILKGEERVDGLMSQFKKLSQSLQALGRYEVSFNPPEKEIRLPDIVLLQLNRILSEWTANVIRHAHAGALAMGFREQPNGRVIIWFFQDNTPFSWRGTAERGGLRSIASRAQSMHAQVRVRRAQQGAVFLLRLKAHR